jgi:hypothetical protein
MGMARTARGSKRKFTWSMFVDAGYRISDRELRCWIRGCKIGTGCSRPDSEQLDLSRAVRSGNGAAGRAHYIAVHRVRSSCPSLLLSVVPGIFEMSPFAVELMPTDCVMVSKILGI